MRVPCLLVFFYGTCVRSEECKNQDSQCYEDSSLLQVRSFHSAGVAAEVLLEAEEGQQSHDDAQFLMKATFGPTTRSMSELEGKTHQQWVVEQMALPVESHRALYRQHINPMFRSSSAGTFGSPRAPCDIGARWVRNVFSRTDIGSAVEVRNGSAIYVGGTFRTDIDQGDLASEWADMTDWVGRLCDCRESLGSSVFLAASDCRYKFAKPNPAVLSASAVLTSFSFSKIGNEPDAVVVTDVFVNCTLTEGDVIQQSGRYYRFDKRLALRANDVERPAEDSVCVGRNFVNEHFCRTPENLFPPPVEGLRLAVFDGASYVSDRARRPSALYHATVPNIDHEGTAQPFTGWPKNADLSAEWTGRFNITAAGVYTFWTGSDDGSRVFIDSNEVLDNSGFHGYKEVSGDVTLSSGEHGIVVEFYQWSGGQSMKLFWQGPDSGDTKEVMPGGKFFSTPSRCALSCGSHGEAASVPLKGHQWPFYATSTWDRPWRYNDGVHGERSLWGFSKPVSL